MSVKHLPDPTLTAVLRHLHGMSNAEIERKSGVCFSTLRNWRLGKTRHPQNITMEFALRAAGFKRIIVKSNGGKP